MLLHRPESKTGTGVIIRVPCGIQPPDKLRDGVFYFLHVILMGIYSRRHHGNRTSRVDSQLMRKILGPHKESDVRKWILDNGVAYTDHSYSEGGHAKAYGIPRRLRQKTEDYEIQGTRLAKKILEWRERERATITEDGEYKDTFRCLRTWANTLDFDIEGCKALLNDEHSVNLYAAEIIHARQVELIQDDYGRIHTAFTRLYSPLRQFISYRGEPLCNCDIKNSQLIFCYALYQESLNDTGNQENLTSASWETRVPGEEGERDGRRSPALCSADLGRLSNPQEVLLREWVESGTLYDRLMEMSLGNEAIRKHIIAKRILEKRRELWEDRFLDYAFSVKAKNAEEWKKARKRFARKVPLKSIVVEEVSTEITRSDFKRMFFRDVLFGRPAAVTPITRLFAGQFPEFYRFIVEQKRHHYADLAREMQRRESSFMFGSVIPRLLDEFPGMPLVTVHDSAMTTPAYCSTVCRVMKEEFAKIGLHPSIKVEGTVAPEPNLTVRKEDELDYANTKLPLQHTDISTMA